MSRKRRRRVWYTLEDVFGPILWVASYWIMGLAAMFGSLVVLALLLS